jgi:hypothetical protein
LESTRGSRVEASLRGLDLELAYTTSRASLLSAFYTPCLDNAVVYDRAAGYFRSSLYVIAGTAVSSFALRGGHARLVCSPSLSPSDIEAMQAGVALHDMMSDVLRTDLEEMLREPNNEPVVTLLATLLALDMLDIRIAFRPGAQGIRRLPRRKRQLSLLHRVRERDLPRLGRRG